MIKVTDFLSKELTSYAAYDNIRKIPSYIDGLKASQRKVIYTLLKKYPKEYIKTETLANVTAAFTNYLHGANNIATAVCTTMTQDFVGANNYPLTKGNSGGWGCRINPTAAAPRYTRMCLSDVAKEVINQDDEEIIGRQYFEGDFIEPKFFVPVFPILFLNGSNGLSTGFSTTIYPRNPKEVIKYIKNKLAGRATNKIELLPWFKGFLGTIRQSPDVDSVVSIGAAKKINSTSYAIQELPIGMDYQKYISILDKLCDEKIIVDYEDCCEPKIDTILFKVKTTRQFSAKYDTEEELTKVFKLIKTLPENLNCIDENNRVREFKSVHEILDAYIDIRLQFYDKRKEYLISKYIEKITMLKSKYIFCNGVVKGEIKVSNTPKEKIISQLEKNEKIVKENDSYDYLLRMPIYSITKERLVEMKQELSKLADELKELKTITREEMWLNDINCIKSLA